MADGERRIVVEVLTPGEVARLEGLIDECKAEMADIRSRMDGLHQTLYEVISTLRRAR